VYTLTLSHTIFCRWKWRAGYIFVEGITREIKRIGFYAGTANKKVLKPVLSIFEGNRAPLVNRYSHCGEFLDSNRVSPVQAFILVTQYPEGSNNFRNYVVEEIYLISICEITLYETHTHSFLRSTLSTNVYMPFSKSQTPHSIDPRFTILAATTFFYNCIRQ